MLSYREVLYITTAAKTGSFVRASEVCHISQPSLSIQIKKIEERLGNAVFIRSVQGVRLTPFGQEILPLLNIILEKFEAIRAHTSQAKNQKLKPLRLGIIPTVGPYLLPQLQELTGVNFTEGTTDMLIQKLLKDELDGALLALPIKLPQLKSSKLLREPFYLTAAKENAYLRHIQLNADFSARELPAECSFLILSEEHCLGEQTAELCGLQQGGMNEAFKQTSLETIRSMVAESNNVTLMPAMAKRAGDGLVYHPMAAQFYRDVGLVYKKSGERVAEIAELEVKLRKLMRQIKSS